MFSEMLASPWHEERLLALVIMVDAYESGDAAERKLVHRDYLANTRYINNWDLVDASAGGIVGAHLDAGDISLLMRLARSKDMWERRIAIVSTFYFIKRGEFGPTLSYRGAAAARRARPDSQGGGVDAARGGEAGPESSRWISPRTLSRDAAHHASICDRAASGGSQEEISGRIDVVGFELVVFRLN